MPNLQAVIIPTVQEVRLGSSAMFWCKGIDNNGQEPTQPISYEWEAAPYIVQEQRYNFSEDKHQLEIRNIKISDNNTSVWCRIDQTENSGPSNKAKARIIVLPSLPGNTGLPPPSSNPLNTVSMISTPSKGASGRSAGVTVAALFFVLIIFVALLVIAYRKVRHSRRNVNLGIGSKLLGSKYGPRKSKITRYTDGEGGYQEPIIPAINPPQYTCLTQVNHINKRPIPPPRTKRGRRNTEPAQLYAVAQEDHSYNMAGPGICNGQKGLPQHAGYMDMSGKSNKRSTGNARRAFSQFDPDDDYENIAVRTISNRAGNVYANENVHGKTETGGRNYNSNKAQGSLLYASLDLGESTSGEVLVETKEEKTTYAKILRILSVFRTMRSTRIRVIHMGIDGKHARGQCDTTRYR